MAAAKLLTGRLLVPGLLVFGLFACTTPPDLTRTRDYHEPAAPADTARALNSLQLKALELMNLRQFQQAIEYLQRAVRVEPRDPLNWHYLAQNYWHLEDYPNCRSMIERARAYTADADLARANDTLYRQCSP